MRQVRCEDCRINSAEFETVTLTASGLTFSALAGGLKENPRGELVICLHGFPDTAWTFRYQVPALVSAGYRVIAPVLRGYEPNSQPADGDYSALALAGDVVDWIDHMGAERVHLAGHDWGALITCAAGALAPQRFHSLTVIAGPHIARAANIMRNVPRQLLLSWYIMFFQLPGIAEMVVKRPGWALLRKLWRDWAPGYSLPEHEWDRLCRQFQQPGVVEAALAYYRQNASPGVFLGWRRLGLEDLTMVPVRSLVIAGLEDGCFDSRMYDHVFLVEDFPAGLRVEKLADAGHFPHQEQPVVFNSLLLDWLAA